MRRRPRKALDPSQVRAIVDFARDLAPLAGLGADTPPIVIAMAESAIWHSLGCTEAEAVALAPGLIQSGVIGYRAGPHGGYRLLVPCGRGRLALSPHDLAEMHERAEGGDR